MTSGWPWYFDRQAQPMTQAEYEKAKYWTEDYKTVGRWGEWGDDLVISTVWLGIDHSFFGHGDPDHVPIIFETMIFGYGDGNYTARYATEAEALAGHQRAVEDIEAGRMPWFVDGDLVDAESDNEGC